MTDEDVAYRASAAIASGAYEEAAHLLRPLAEHESEYALVTLGWLQECGLVGPADRSAARQHYEHAAAIGSALGHLYLGRLFKGDGKLQAARDVLRIGAKIGSSECRSELDDVDNLIAEQMAVEAIGRTEYHEAVRLLRPAADRGSEYARLSLGWIYETGRVGVADIETAKREYKRAQNEGSAAACFELGRVLLKSKEIADARAIFDLGAERGDIACMARLGRMMIDGSEGDVDVSAGVVWLRKAASKGHIMAQRTLLNLEKQGAKSWLAKIWITAQIVRLAFVGAQDAFKDPWSSKVR